MTLPLMPKATAVWLVENTALTFEQIAAFTGMHLLEIQNIADGESEHGVRGLSPMISGQLTAEEIKRCEGNPALRLLVRKQNTDLPKVKKGPRYTPLSKRRDKPGVIVWLLRNHPELSDAQLSKLIGTTKPTIESLRSKTHWNYKNIVPLDPVFAGLCTQTELNANIEKATGVKAAANPPRFEESLPTAEQASPFADIRQPKTAEDARAMAEKLFGGE